MQMTTVFDGLLPASPDPGNVLGTSVVVWTPTRDGIYAALVTLPDEPGAPFMYSPTVTVDLDDAQGTIVGNIGDALFGSLNSGEVTNGDSVEGSATLANNLGHQVRVVVKIGLVADATDVEVGDTAIVPLDELKLALGLDPLDTSDDLLLTLLESQAAAFVESQIGRRFSAPIDRTEFIVGLGNQTLFLGGHVAGDPPAIVSLRARALSAREFEDVDDEEWTLRGDTLVALGGRWSHLTEYEVVYSDGYLLGTAPADIRALVIDLVSIAFASLGEEGVKSESIGDYSYTLDSTVTNAALSLSDTSAATLNRYRGTPL